MKKYTMDNEIEFYSEKFTQTMLDHRRRGFSDRLYYYLTLSNYKNRFFDKMLNSKNKSKILDLGCGGGNPLVARKGVVVGVDLSASALKNSKNIYNHVIRAEITNLPFKNNTFDFIVSMDVLGHISKLKKNIMVNEIRRCLRVNGTTIHYIEADSKDPLINKARKEKDLYEKYFINQDGHIGLETISQIDNRFRTVFSDAQVTRAYLVAPIGEYSKRFDNEYKYRSFIFRFIVLSDKFLLKNKVIRYSFDSFLFIIDRLLSKFTPRNVGGGAFVVAKK